MLLDSVVKYNPICRASVIKFI